MAYLGNVPARSFISFERQVFTIVNSQTAYTLSHSVTNENDIRLVINNIVQEPGSGKAYTASGTTLTLSAALVNGTDEMYCVFLGRAVGTVNAPAGSVDTAQLAADAVTGAKIADDAISDEHLDPTAITGQTAETSIADDDLILISDTSASAALKKMTKANFVSGVGGDNTPAFFAYLSANQTVAHNSTSRINCNTEVVDTDSAYDNSSNYRFTVPSGEGGKYFVFGGVRPNTSTDYEYSEAYISVNGSNKLQTTGRNIGRDSRILNGILDLSAGDYLELQYYQDSGGDITVSGNSTQHRSYFGAYKLIGV